MTQQKTVTTKQIKTRLDQLLKVVRYSTSAEFGVCETCLKTFPVKELQAGHFIKRGNLWLKYDPRNLLSQCIRCNHFMGGCQDKAAYAIIKRYGLETFEELIQKDYQWMELDKKPTLKRNELITYYNYWLRKNRETEEKLGVQLVPKSWQPL